KFSRAIGQRLVGGGKAVPVDRKRFVEAHVVANVPGVGAPGILAPVIERAPVGPAVVSQPSHVRALEYQVGFAIVANDEDDVGLAIGNGQSAEIHTAQPFGWNLQATRFAPFAFSKVPFAILRRRLRRSLERAKPVHVAGTFATVVTHAVD